MQIQNENGRFFVANDGKDLAEITYSLDKETGELVIDHTRVSEELRGQGTGQELVRAVVDKARNENLKLYPCAPMLRINLRSTRSTKTC